MPKNFTSNTFSSTYKDDFDPNNNYHKVLFNSGVALQSRELNQIQSIIQEEIARLGKHIFKEGAAVNAGNISVSSEEYIKLDTITNGLPDKVLNSDGDLVSPLIDVIFTGNSSGVQFIVNDVLDATDEDPATLYVQYIDNGTQEPLEDVGIRVSVGEDISGGDFNLTVQSVNVTDNLALGLGTKVSVQPGDFFAENHFVQANGQYIYFDKYSNTPSGNVGFLVLQDIITVDDTVDLYDNQGLEPNLSSPGADRYRIRLELKAEVDTVSEDNFIPIAKLKDGVILSDVVDNTKEVYNKLGEQMARRTFEESGDYITERFKLSFRENDEDSDKIDFVVSPGVAYINGYRAAVNTDTVITIDKARDTSVLENVSTPITYGNYYIADSSTWKGVPNLFQFEKANLYNGVNGTGDVIGTVNISKVEPNGDGNYRVYLFEFSMNQGENEHSVKSVGDASQPVRSFFNVVLENGRAIRKESGDNRYLFNLPMTRTKGISSVQSFVIQRHFAVESLTGSVTLTIPSSHNSVFEDPTRWLAAQSGGNETELLTITNVQGIGTRSVSFDLLDGNGDPFISTPPYTVEVLAEVRVTSPASKGKIYTQNYVETVTPDAEGNITLKKADIIKVKSVMTTDATPVNVTSNYILDNGQRDTYYGLGELEFDDSLPSELIITNPVTVTYDYFFHTEGYENGNYFDLGSYPVAYEDIPIYTNEAGNQIDLRDVLDFRPIQGLSGDYVESRISPLPRNNSSIILDGELYLPKNVKLIINEDGALSVIEGKSSLEPKMPKSPNRTMDLYLVEMAPYTFSVDDLAMTAIEAKRYTMKDIGSLEERLSNLEETTALTLLELQTSTFNVLDELGNIRSKSGFFVDNFMDQARSDVATREYNASIDPSRGIMRPKFRNDTIRLIRNKTSNEQSGVVIRGDNIYLDYSEVTYLEQKFMTKTENVNPFAITTKRGILTISPSRDNWMEVKYAAPRVIKGDDKFSVDQSTLWDNWTWNWTGNEKVGTTLGRQTTGDSTTWGRTVRGPLLSTNVSRDGRIQTTTNTFETTQTGRRTVNTAAAVVSGFSTIREVVDDLEKSTTNIPVMRSQMIYFKAEGMRPNTQVFPFFGGKEVSQWCREETYQNTELADADYSDGFEDLTQHPNGPSELKTDAFGSVEGTFFLPATESLQFETGAKELRLLDITSYQNRSNATTWASTWYRSNGKLTTRQKTIQSTRTVFIDTENTVNRTSVVRRGTRTERNSIPLDPLAQTFMVEEPLGVFVTGIDLKFAKKPNNNLPVYVQIRPTENGYPSASEVVPGTTVLKLPSQVNVASSGNEIQTTTFTFPEPAFLTGNGTEYSIVVISDSNHYEVYTARAGDFLLDDNGTQSTTKKLRKQPTMGSLFKSQNGRTWEPDQSQDMTFTLKRAKFNTNLGTVVFKNADAPRLIRYGHHIFSRPDQYRLTGAATNEVYIYDRGHGYKADDKVTFNNQTTGIIGGFDTSYLNGTHVIERVDPYGYTIAFPDLLSESINWVPAVGDNSIKTYTTRQSQFNVGILKAEYLLPEGTNIRSKGRFTNTDYIKSDVWDDENVNINTNIHFNDGPRLYTNSTNALDKIVSPSSPGLLNIDYSIDIAFDMETNSDFISPVIDTQALNFAMINNLIDNQDEIADDVFQGNISFRQRTERHPFSGTSIAKHITKVTNLAQSAIGLKILLAAHKPEEAAFDVYYRTNADKTFKNGVISKQYWIKDEPEIQQPSDENPSIFRDYTYLVGGNVGLDQPFDQFQVKIVMRSTNSSKVPLFKDLRVIALYD